MIGRSISLTVSIVLLFAFSACSTTASDVVSYSSYVQAVEKLQSESKEFTKQFRKLKKTSKGVEAVRKEAKTTRDNMSDVYRIGRSIVDRAKRLEVSFLASPGALSNQASKWRSLRTDVKSFVGQENVIDDLFQDPEKKSLGKIKTLEVRFDSRKKTISALISKCDGIIFSAFGRIKQVDIIVSKINNAERPSEVVNITDKYLSQMQDLFSQLRGLTFCIQGITKLVQFTGASEKEEQARNRAKRMAIHRKQMEDMGFGKSKPLPPGSFRRSIMQNSMKKRKEEKKESTKEKK